MPVAEATILQEIVFLVDFVEFSGDVSAARSRLDELQATLVDSRVDLPKTQMFVRYMVEEESTFQGCVIPTNGKVFVQFISLIDAYMCQ